MGAFNNNYIEYESKGDKDKIYSVKDYLHVIMSYLEKVINNYKATITDFSDLSGVWKIQLTMRINFLSSLDPEKNRVMNSKNDKIEIMMGTETDDIIKESFESFLKRYQKNLEEKMKDSNFVFESVDLLNYSLHKITLKRWIIYKVF